MLAAANLLEILPVKEAAAKYLDRHTDAGNCLGINRFAELHSCHALEAKTKGFALQHFTEVCNLQLDVRQPDGISEIAIQYSYQNVETDCQINVYLVVVFFLLVG